jgi:hypothetical protein
VTKKAKTAPVTSTAPSPAPPSSAKSKGKQKEQKQSPFSALVKDATGQMRKTAKKNSADFKRRAEKKKGEPSKVGVIV